MSGRGNKWVRSLNCTVGKGDKWRRKVAGCEDRRPPKTRLQCLVETKVATVLRLLWISSRKQYIPLAKYVQDLDCYAYSFDFLMNCNWEGTEHRQRQVSCTMKHGNRFWLRQEIDSFDAYLIVYAVDILISVGLFLLLYSVKHLRKNNIKLKTTWKALSEKFLTSLGRRLNWN